MHVAVVFCFVFVCRFFFCTFAVLELHFAAHNILHSHFLYFQPHSLIRVAGQAEGCVPLLRLRSVRSQTRPPLPGKILRFVVDMKVCKILGY